MKHLHKIFLIFNFSFLIFNSAHATHLMGGWAGYQYLGLNSSTGNYQYIVTVKVYRYCDGTTYPCSSAVCTTAMLDPSIQLGAYTQDFLNPNNPNKALAASFTIPLTSDNWVPLPGAAQCATAPIVCVEEGIYSMQIELPPSNGGYHLFFERCCRNGNIINLANPGAEGMSFYAFVPPTFINNSSPTFAQPPVPYICANDTASILNTAFDPDGDVVVYSLVQPYSGYSTAGNPIPAPPSPYTFPIPVVTYGAGYSATQPFGPGGYASVNSFTGQSQYLSPNTGYYVVAVELKEYRNNQLVGITRLDMQIIVVPCPPSTPPHLSSSTSQTNWVANEGDHLCFPITYIDPSGDSVYFHAIGNIFNAPTNPTATITPNPNSGLGSVTSQFCWNLSCGEVGNYIFIVQVPNNGCPPKVANNVFTIQVLPYLGPSSISGATPVCPNTSSTYSVAASSGASFTWTVTGGIISSGQGTNSINVNWGSSGNGTVNLTSYNSNGCAAGPITLNVTIQPVPVVNMSPPATICLGNTTTLSSTGGGNYSWSPASGLNNVNIANPVASPTISTTYTVLVSSSAGCTNTGTVSVTVNPLPVVNAGNNNTICAGFNTTIGGNPTGPPGSSYNWIPSTGLNNTTFANPTASPTASTNYTVVVSGANTCADTGVVAITVNPNPVANAGQDVTICPGFNTSLQGSGGGTYNWSPSGSLNNPNISNPVASPTASTTYTLTVTLNSCTNTDSVSITALPMPAVNAGPDASICIGNSTTLNATGIGTFTWSPSTGLSCTTCTSPTANPTSTTNYSVTISDANSCTNNDTVRVSVIPLPLANAGPRPGWVCPGFNITLNSFNGTSYVWSPSSSLNNPNISNPVASPTANTTYTVNITDASGCKNSDTLTIFLNHVIPTNAGTDPTICIGQSTTLGGSPTAPSPNTIYQWFPSIGLNNASLANPIASPIATTTYIVTTSSDTCSGVDTVIVYVNALPVISAGADISVCIGNAATLTASGGILYSWNTNATTTSIFVSPTSLSTYTVTGTDANGCSKSDSASVFVNALPSVSAGNDVSICIGNTTTLIASGATNYFWSTNETTTSIFVSPTSFSTYTITGTDANGCSKSDSASVFVNALPSVSAGNDVSICIGNTTTLIASGATNYFWSTNETTTSIFVSPTSFSTYTITGTDTNGCSKSDSASVFVNALPAVSAGNDVSMCIGNTTTLTASGATNYLWSTNETTTSIFVSPTSFSTYTITGTDTNSCSKTDTVNVNVFPLPLITTSPDTAICKGDSAQLNAFGGASYSWSPASSLSNSTISNPIATPVTTSTYTVIATSADGCTKSDSVQVLVNQLPNISAGANTILCPGDSVSLHATGGISYVWTPPTGLSNPNISNPVATPSVIITYTVTGIDSNGCRNSNSVLVSIGTTPSADFGYSLSLACDGMQAQFSDSSQNASDWSWNFGDGSSESSQQNPAHTFPYNSNYIITLTASNPPCLNAIQKTISLSALKDYLSIQTANVFTPNNDGVNDCFRLKMNPQNGLSASFDGCSDLTIYGRWGVPVYHSDYSGSCWDGRTTAGTIVPEGTYFYIFDLNGIHLKGFITVLR